MYTNWKCMVMESSLKFFFDPPMCLFQCSFLLACYTSTTTSTHPYADYCAGNTLLTAWLMVWFRDELKKCLKKGEVSHSSLKPRVHLHYTLSGESKRKKKKINVRHIQFVIGYKNIIYQTSKRRNKNTLAITHSHIHDAGKCSENLRRNGYW